MKLQEMFTSFLAGTKNVVMNLVVLFGVAGSIFAYALPDTRPIDTAQYEAGALNGKLYFKVDIAKDATYGSDLILYIGNDYLGSLPIPQVGHRVTTATYNLPPSVVNSSKFKLTVYWQIKHWTSVISPTDIFERMEVKHAITSNSASATTK